MLFKGLESVLLTCGNIYNVCAVPCLAVRFAIFLFYEINKRFTATFQYTDAVNLL